MKNKVMLFEWPWKQSNISHANVCRYSWKGPPYPFGKVQLLNANLLYLLNDLRL